MYGDRKPVPKGLLGNKWFRGFLAIELAGFFTTFGLYLRLNSSPQDRYWMHKNHPSIYEGYCALISYAKFGKEIIERDQKDFKLRDEIIQLKSEGKL